MAKQNRTEYFLGGNTVNGFYSVYDSLTDPKSGDRLYIIKSGPGSGKSSFMKNIAAKAEEAGRKVEYVYCSGDPDSLDAIYIPSLKAAVVDGTSPHVIEPAFPAVSDTYIDLSGSYDFAKVQAVKSEVTDLFKNYKGHYKNAYEHLARFKSLALAGEYQVSDHIPAIRKKAKTMMRKYGVLPTEKKENVKGRCRFISAFTFKGYVELSDQLQSYDRAVILSSACGLDSLFCAMVKDITQEEGVFSLSYLNPLMPEKIDHIALPDASLIFISKSALAGKTQVSGHSVNLDTLVDRARVKEIKFLKKALKKPATLILESAKAELEMAKSLHDQLEKAYNPYVDFGSVYALSDKYYDKISGAKNHL